MATRLQRVLKEIEFLTSDELAVVQAALNARGGRGVVAYEDKQVNALILRAYNAGGDRTEVIYEQYIWPVLRAITNAQTVIGAIRGAWLAGGQGGNRLLLKNTLQRLNDQLMAHLTDIDQEIGKGEAALGFKLVEIDITNVRELLTASLNFVKGVDETGAGLMVIASEPLKSLYSNVRLNVPKQGRPASTGARWIAEQVQILTVKHPELNPSNRAHQTLIGKRIFAYLHRNRVELEGIQHDRLHPNYPQWEAYNAMATHFNNQGMLNKGSETKVRDIIKNAITTQSKGIIKK